ncbi:helix-turn-helix domain-containing protein [Terrabacter sp. 2YAF2]|uniref:helix-turn-helix domain-containing protein n=1 Tax=Terrabacter sp. 2YAF2 TaxID=3233026 RepID=UPI003F96427C
MEPTTPLGQQAGHAGCPARAEHHEHVPGPRLSRGVERAVGYRLSGFPAGVHVGMPSGSVPLVVPLDDALTVADGGGAPRTYGSVIAGLSAAPARIHHDGSQHGVQIALRPGAIRTLFGMPAAELAARSYELVDVAGEDADHLRERLHEAEAWSARFALVETWLEGLLDRTSRPRPPEPEVAEAWRLITTSGGAVSIRDVASQVGWSMRRLQSRFRLEFGLSPKTAAIVARFERSVPLVASGRTSLTDVAVRCGWSDQAHMDRDWRALAGTAPSRWRTEDVLAAT